MKWLLIQLLNIVKISSSLVGMVSASKQSSRSAGSGNWSIPRSKGYKKSVYQMNTVTYYNASLFSMCSLLSNVMQETEHHHSVGPIYYPKYKIRIQI